MIKSTGIMRETGNNVPEGTVFMAPDGETGQTALEIPDRKIGKSRGYIVIIKRLRYTKQNVKGQVGLHVVGLFSERTFSSVFPNGEYVEPCFCLETERQRDREMRVY